MGQDGTTDGAGGPVVTVTNSSDLIDYMSRSGPYVIQVSGMISVPGGMHEVTSNKTVTVIQQIRPAQSRVLLRQMQVSEKWVYPQHRGRLIHLQV